MSAQATLIGHEDRTQQRTIFQDQKMLFVEFYSRKTLHSRPMETNQLQPRVVPNTKPSSAPSEASVDRGLI